MVIVTLVVVVSLVVVGTLVMIVVEVGMSEDRLLIVVRDILITIIVARVLSRENAVAHDRCLEDVSVNDLLMLMFMMVKDWSLELMLCVLSGARHGSVHRRDVVFTGSMVGISVVLGRAVHLIMVHRGLVFDLVVHRSVVFNGVVHGGVVHIDMVNISVVNFGVMNRSVVDRGVVLDGVVLNSVVDRSVVLNGMVNGCVVHISVVHISVVHISMMDFGVVDRGMMFNSLVNRSVMHFSMVHFSVVYRSVVNRDSNMRCRNVMSDGLVMDSSGVVKNRSFMGHGSVMNRGSMVRLSVMHSSSVMGNSVLRGMLLGLELVARALVMRADDRRVVWVVMGRDFVVQRNGMVHVVVHIMVHIVVHIVADLMMDRCSMVHYSLVMDGGSVVDNGLMVDINMMGIMMGIMVSIVMSIMMIAVVSVCRMMLVSQLLVVLVMRREVMRVVVEMMTIVVIHLQHERSVLDVDLAAHEERGVVVEAPVVACVPLLLIERLKVVPPAQFEIFLVHIVIIDLDEIILGIPRHVGVIEVVVPGRPGRSPEVHHELRGHGKEVHIFGALALAHELVLDEPADLLRGPLDCVGDPVVARVEARGVVVVLGTIPPNDVHGEWIFVYGRHELNIDLVPAMGPILRRVREEGLNGTHLSRILHSHHELAVVEPLLRADLTREVISLSNTCDNGSNELLHLCRV